jgi:hypothetical protein
MNILIDIGHPAHVHLFRNAAKIWIEHGHSITITIRDKDITSELLDLYGFSYHVASIARKGTIGLAFELIEHDFGVLKAAIRNKCQVLIGTSVAISHVSRILGVKSIVFNEDDASIANTFVKLAYPLANAIVTPTCLNENHGKRHFVYDGYQKLAYLHPKYFKPNSKILEKLGVLPNEPYFILRFVSLKAAHDQGESGLNEEMKLKIIRKFTNYGRVFITSEIPLSGDLLSYRLNIPTIDIHDALYFSKMLIGDSQSMAVEAAILGVPSIRVNTFAKRCSVLIELENKYGLSFSFLPSKEEDIFNKIDELMNKQCLKDEWQEKRTILLNDKIDVTKWIVDFVENF